jgi:hypothetical protein
VSCRLWTSDGQTPDIAALTLEVDVHVNRGSQC